MFCLEGRLGIYQIPRPTTADRFELAPHGQHTYRVARQRIHLADFCADIRGLVEPEQGDAEAEGGECRKAKIDARTHLQTNEAHSWPARLCGGQIDCPSSTSG